MGKKKAQIQKAYAVGAYTVVIEHGRSGTLWATYTVVTRYESDVISKAKEFAALEGCEDPVVRSFTRLPGAVIVS